MYKKSKTSPLVEGEGSHSTKPFDFSGPPKPDISLATSPEAISKPLPCESYVDQWLSTLNSTDSIGGVVAATVMQVDQHRETVVFHSFHLHAPAGLLTVKRSRRIRRRSRLCNRNGTDCALAKLGTRLILGNGLMWPARRGRMVSRFTLA